MNKLIVGFGLTVSVLGLMAWAVLRPVGSNAGTFVLVALMSMAAACSFWLLFRKKPPVPHSAAGGGKGAEGVPSEMARESRRLTAMLRLLDESLPSTGAPGGMENPPGAKTGAKNGAKTGDPGQARLVAKSADPDAKQRRILQDAWQEGAIEMVRRPVIALPSRRRAFEEVSLCAVADDGSWLLRDQFVPVAMAEDLMPELDRLALARTIPLLRGAVLGGVLTPAILTLSGASWTRPNVGAELLSLLGDAAPVLAPHLIIAMTQQDLGRWRGPLYEASARISELGYYLALHEVNDLDLDFSELKELRFRYVICPLPVLLLNEERAAPGWKREAFLEPFNPHGIDVIISHVAHVDALEILNACRIPFATGEAFGGYARGRAVSTAIPA